MNVSKITMKVMGVLVVALLAVPMGTAFLMWVADGNERVGFASAKIISVRYIAAVIVLMLLLLPVFVIAGRRPSDASLTWGEAMVAATYVFFVLFWAYGVVPHEFLNWADSELGWRPDIKIIGPEATWTWWSGWKRVPVTVNKQVIRDLIAVEIYAVGLGGLIWGWSFWNNRDKKAAEQASIEKVSTYGRPLVAPAGKA